ACIVVHMNGRRDRALKSRSCGLDILLGPDEVFERRQSLVKAGGIAIEPEAGLQSRQANFVDSQRPFHRVLANALEQILAAGDNARLRTAEQLVTGEGDEIGALGKCFPYGRLGREAVATEIDERA